MTGNKFAGQICVYCCVQPSTSDDHVFARKFFLEANRSNLLQVPACDSCNGAKGELESELMLILPFGGRHTDASENLARLGAARIAKNKRVARLLTRQKHHIWLREAGLLRRGISVPLDWERVANLFAYITRALAWHHFQVRLGPECFVETHPLVGPIGQTLRRLQRLNAKERVEKDVGGGTFHYWGAQGTDNPQITAWEFSVYGGIRSEHSGDNPTNIGAVTGPVRTLNRALLVSRWRRGTRLHD